MTTCTDLDGRMRTLKAIAFAAAALLGACGAGDDAADDDGDARADAAGASDAAPTGLDLWDGWAARTSAVLEDPGFIASDPTVAAVGDAFAMFYSRLVPNSFDPETETGQLEITSASSSDGVTWTRSDTAAMASSLGTAFENFEASEVVIAGDEVWLYASAYTELGDPVEGYPASLYRATSTDGVAFALDETAVLPVSDDGPDGDAVYSPTILATEDGLTMIYTGHCYLACAEDPGVALLGASSTDGVAWTRHDGRVLAPDPAVPWMAGLVAEAALARGPDGAYYLFFTGFTADETGLAIGVARADSPFGPYEVRPEPIVTAADVDFAAGKVLAPTVLVEADRARMWFTAIGPEGAFRIGYAETLAR